MTESHRLKDILISWSTPLTVRYVDEMNKYSISGESPVYRMSVESIEDYMRGSYSEAFYSELYSHIDDDIFHRLDELWVELNRRYDGCPPNKSWRGVYSELATRADIPTMFLGNVYDVYKDKLK